MARINLLPWRENLRAKRQQEFGVIMAVCALLAAAAVWGWYQYSQGLIDNQKRRNQYLQTEINKLDDQIKEIKHLEKTRKQLISRMKVVENLQSSRPQIVHLFDELVKTLPEGVYLTKVSQRGGAVSVVGHAESNARISAFMRAVEASEWLNSPRLKSIEQDGEADERGLNTFSLDMVQVIPQQGAVNEP